MQNKRHNILHDEFWNSIQSTAGSRPTGSMAPGVTKRRKNNQSEKSLSLDANRRGVRRVQRGHPSAGDPGKGSGFDLAVSCPWGGALVEPWDPWGETLAGQNL